MAKKEITTGKDFLNNELAVGDLIAYAQGDSSGLSLGRVSGFTAKMVKVQKIDLPNTYNTLGGWSNRSHITRGKQQVIKIFNNEEVFKDLPVDWIAHLFAETPQD